MPAGQRLRHHLAGGLLGLGPGGQRLGGLLAPLLGLGQPGRRLVRRRAHLEQALRPRAAALRPEGPEQVAVPRHGPASRIFPNEAACFAQVRDHHDVVKKLRCGLRQASGRPYEFGGGDGNTGRDRRGARDCEVGGVG
jgi:hypothetical protein